MRPRRRTLRSHTAAEVMLAPVPGLTAPSGAFSGKPAGAQYRAQRRARAPEPRWGRAVPHSLRTEVAGSPCWLLARAWRILAVVLAAQDAFNWKQCFPLWPLAAARTDHLDRSLMALWVLPRPVWSVPRIWGRGGQVRGHQGLRQQPPHLAGGVGSSNPRVSSLERPY